MRFCLLAALLLAGCAAMTPRSVKNEVSQLDRDFPLMVIAISSMTHGHPAHDKLIADLQQICSNIAAMNQELR